MSSLTNTEELQTLGPLYADVAHVKQKLVSAATVNVPQAELKLINEALVLAIKSEAAVIKLMGDAFQEYVQEGQGQG